MTSKHWTVVAVTAAAITFPLTGYDVVVANANLDSSLSGPTWGTWNLYSFDDELMFTGPSPAGRRAGRVQNQVPRGVGFIGRSVIGGVSGFGIEGDMAAYSVTGDIDVAAMSVTEATTVNGSIHAAVGRVDWRGSINFVTVNGDITLDFPAELSAELDLATLNGHIASDYPILVDGRISPRRLRGVVGAGGRGVIAKTVNGNIVVRRL